MSEVGAHLGFSTTASVHHMKTGLLFPNLKLKGETTPLFWHDFVQYLYVLPIEAHND